MQASVKIFCLLNRYEKTDQGMLRHLRMWQTKGLQEKLDNLLQTLQTKSSQVKKTSLLYMKQMVVNQKQDAFYYWIQAALLNQNGQTNLLGSSSHNSTFKQANMMSKLLRNSHGGAGTMALFSSPSRKHVYKPMQTAVMSSVMPVMQFPTSTNSGGAISAHQQKQLQQQIARQKSQSRKRTGSREARSISKTGKSQTPSRS